jgi:hypothetical protein
MVVRICFEIAEVYDRPRASVLAKLRPFLRDIACINFFDRWQLCGFFLFEEGGIADEVYGSVLRLDEHVELLQFLRSFFSLIFKY